MHKRKKLGGGIEWTGKTRWNPLVGCSKVTQACKHCYAIEVAVGNVRRFQALVEARLYEHTLTWKQLMALATVRASVDGGGWSRRAALAWHKLADPLLWSKPRLVFPNSMSDLLHESLDDDTVLGLYGIMAYATKHTFQALTKRPERLAKLTWQLQSREWGSTCTSASRLHHYARALLEGAPAAVHATVMDVEVPGLTSLVRESLAAAGRDAVQRDVDRALMALDAAHAELGGWRGFQGENIWWGTSVGSHEDLERFWPPLARAHVAHRWLSIEPLLGEVRLRRVVVDHPIQDPWLPLTTRQIELDALSRGIPSGVQVEWVVVGGESVQPGQTPRPMPIAAAERIIADCQAAGVPVFFKQMGKQTIDASGLVQIGERAKGVPYEDAPDHLKVRELPAAFLRYER